MQDRQAPKPGTFGVVQFVDDIGTVHVAWRSGGSLGVAFGADHCHIATSEELAKYKLTVLANQQPKDRCPRCGATITPDNRLLALSRRLDIMICERDGTFEALEDAGMVDKIPLTEWTAVKEGWK